MINTPPASTRDHQPLTRLKEGSIISVEIWVGEVELWGDLLGDPMS